MNESHEVLNNLKQMIIEGDVQGSRELAEQALSQGVDARILISDYLVPAMDEVGNLFESGEYYIPEMLVSARAASQILDLTEPIMAKGDHERTGLVIIGTVKGDLHDIGKNIVSMMLKGAGFRVEDLGTDVKPQKFVDAITQYKPDIVGLSSLLTTTMGSIRETVEALDAAGIRDRVKVMIGGAPITQAFSDEIGSDAYAPDAAVAVRIAKQIMEEKKASELIN